MKYMVYWSVFEDADTPEQAAAQAHRHAKDNVETDGFAFRVEEDTDNRGRLRRVGEVIWLKPREAIK